MNVYAIEARIFGTVYIKASDQTTADRILDRLCTNTIDARDRTWFSELEHQFLPMVSFGTSFTADGPVPEAQLILISERVLEHAQRSENGRRDSLFPNAENLADFEDMPVYQTDLDLTTKAFVRAVSLKQAEEVLKTFKGTHIDLEMHYWRWFSKPGEHYVEESGTDQPLLLSTALHVSKRSAGCELYRAWPETFYRVSSDGNYEAIETEIVKNPDWPDSLELFEQESVGP